MAYGAVVSLKQTTEKSLVHSPQSNFVLPDSEIEFISDARRYLQAFLEKTRSLPSSKRVDVSSSERRVKDAAKKLEDPIDSSVFGQLLLRFDLRTSINECLTYAVSRQLLRVREEIAAFNLSDH